MAHVTLWVDPLKIPDHSAKFGGHRHCSRKDLMNFMDQGPFIVSYHSVKLVAIVFVAVEI